MTTMSAGDINEYQKKRYKYFEDFQKESNLIEGITRVTKEQVQALMDFVELDEINDEDILTLALRLQPKRMKKPKLRYKSGMDVRVGSYYPPPGGPEIKMNLHTLLKSAYKTPSFETHLKYESLHPLTDVNGRTGRALWLWQIIRELNRLPTATFHKFWYYQSLNYSRQDLALWD